MTMRSQPTVEVELGDQRLAIGLLQIRVLRLLALFGSASAMADYMGVHTARPTEWANGSTPGGSTAALLADLSFVWERATEDLADEAVRLWLSSANRFLGDQPLEAIRVGGLAEVLAARDAHLEGSYA